jgi:AAHS family 4-hydroxybenzoate transporter-like MFS transporter
MIPAVIFMNNGLKQSWLAGGRINMTRPVIDVTRLVDEQRIGAFTIRLVFLSFVIMLTDGYDLLAASYGAPGLIAAWHLRPEQLGPMFSASPLGMVVGCPLLGWLGDRFGRRMTVILATVIFGVFTLFCAGAHSVEQLMVLRFITGIGLGGMLPNTVALNAEFAPRRARAMLVVLMFMGVTIGSMLPALVVTFVPASGWQGLYVVGGVAPLVFVVVLAIWLPESIRFLTLRQGKVPRVRLQRLVRKLRPDLALSPDTVFVSSDSARGSSVPIAELFHDGLHWITPLLWFLIVNALLANFFLYNWMPVLFRSNGFSSSEAALTTACYYVGGLAGGLTVSRLIDRRGLPPVIFFFVLSCPAVACIGLPNLTPLAVAGAVFLAGFCVVGVTLGLNATSGLIYPTRMRAAGAGWAFGVGRLGGIAGPMLGAWLIGMHLSTSQIFLAPAVPLAIGAVGCFVLTRLCRTRFHGDQLDDAAATVSATVSTAESTAESFQASGAE